jgi:hypothetical protein
LNAWCFNPLGRIKMDATCQWAHWKERPRVFAPFFPPDRSSHGIWRDLFSSQLVMYALFTSAQSPPLKSSHSLMDYTRRFINGRPNRRLSITTGSNGNARSSLYYIPPFSTSQQRIYTWPHQVAARSVCHRIGFPPCAW